MRRPTPLALGLLALAVALGGAGYYTTDVRQADRIQTLKDSRRVAALAVSRVDDLLKQESVSEEAAEAALSRWYSRYKYIPREMDTADIVEYLELLTRSGFEQFDLALAGRSAGPDFSTYRFDVEGTGTYPALYRLVWNLENNREFYRVNDLRMEHIVYTREGQSDRDLVKFTFGLEIYYAGIEGISAPEEDLSPIPTGLLLPNSAARDIFRPLVRVPRDAPATSVDVGPPPVAQGGPPGAPAPAQTAPEARERPVEPALPEGLDAERAVLLLVAGGKAVFVDDAGRRFTVGPGDPVLGGEVVAIDNQRGGVRVRLGEGDDARYISRTLGDRDRDGDR